jgi:DnaK suppressor protein
VTQLQLERLKSKLETSQKDLCGSLQNRGSIAVERTADLTDEADLAGERDIALWSLDSNSVQLRLVEAALARAADGTYGCCLNCDEQISLKRLAALPYAVLCVTCQQEEDQGRINLGGYWEAGSIDSAPEKDKRSSLRTQSAANA